MVSSSVILHHAYLYVQYTFAAYSIQLRFTIATWDPAPAGKGRECGVRREMPLERGRWSAPVTGSSPRWGWPSPLASTTCRGSDGVRAQC